MYGALFGDWLCLSCLIIELTGSCEGGGGGVGGGGGGRGGGDYVVSSKWARDTDINRKIRSDLRTTQPAMSDNSCIYIHAMEILLYTVYEYQLTEEHAKYIIM